MTTLGELKERLAFEARGDLSAASPPGDDYGNTEGDWGARFTVNAGILPLKGGEDVMAARLGGTQPVVITVQYSSATLGIGPEWRARDTRTGTVYAITSPAADMDRKRLFLSMVAVAGVAA